MGASKQKVRELFMHAVSKVPPEDWRNFAEASCLDADACKQLLKMLQMHRNVGDFLEKPAVALTEPIPPRPVEPQIERIGPYRLVAPIGEGGMGVVWRAEQAEPVQREVAIKLIQPGIDSPQFIARFEAERQTLALMDHPNIAKILDAGTTETGRPYLVMELVHGIPITKYCDQYRLTPRARLELFVSVCNAVQHAHQKGIIHRDIKPSNVLVTRYDDRPMVKVIDFGVAKVLQSLPSHSVETALGSLVGTPEYMSPEQADLHNHDVDTRSDVYSLGVLLYELLTGSTPVDRKQLKNRGILEVLRVIREEDPPKPSTKLSSVETLPTIAATRGLSSRELRVIVKGELDWIVMKCLEKDRGRRYETATNLAGDVMRFLANEAVHACPPSASYRLRKMLLRHRTAFFTGALLCLMFLVALGAVAGTIGWAMRNRSALEDQFASDRDARRNLLEREIQSAMLDAESAFELGKLPEARAQTRRAQSLIASGDVSESVKHQVHQWHRELDFVAQLEDVRLERADGVDDGIDWKSADRAYQKVFAAHQLDLAACDTDTLVQAIQNMHVQDRVITALDDWAMTKYLGRITDFERLVEVVGQLDDDPWRARFRKVLLDRDRTQLLALGREKEASAQSAVSALLLASVLSGTGEKMLAIDILRQVQLRYPTDFWINLELGQLLTYLRPHQALDGAGYIRVAVSQRPESGYPINSLGYSLWLQNRPAEAEIAFRKAIQLQPNSARAHMNLGVVLRIQGNTLEGLECYRTAVELKPNYFKARLNLGLALDGQKDFAGAVEQFREATRLNPTDADAHRAYIGALRNLNTPESLAEATDKSLQRTLKQSIVPSPFHWLADVMPQEAKSVILALSIPPAPAPKTKDLAKVKTRAVVDRELRDRIKNNPADVDALARLSALVLDVNPSDSIKFANDALNVDPGSLPAKLALARAYRARKNIKDAITAYNDYLGKDPANSIVLVELGLVHGTVNQWAIAEKLFQSALKYARPGQYDFRLLGISQERQGKFADAEASYQRAVQEQPKAANLNTYRVDLIRMLNKQGKFDRAEPIAAYLVEGSPDDVYFRCLLAECCTGLNKPDKAQEHLRHALDRTPSRITELSRIAVACSDAGQWKLANEAWARFVTAFPNAGVARYQQAISFLGSGDVDQYRSVCSAYESRSHSLQDLEYHAKLVRTCTICPNVIKNVDGMMNHANRVRLLPNNRGLTGAVHYRAQRYEEAVGSLASNSHLTDFGPRDWVFLAMALAQTGKTSEAQAALEKATSATLPPVWWIRVELDYLRREAEALLETKRSR